MRRIGAGDRDGDASRRGAPRLAGGPTCRSLPIVRLPRLMLGAVTVAVICRRLDGVLKPAGVSTAIVVVPAFCGSNAVTPSSSPGLNTTGLTVITPTVVFELVTGTFTGGNPPRSSWVSAKVRAPRVQPRRSDRDARVGRQRRRREVAGADDDEPGGVG